MNPFKSLLRSRKFLLLVLDTVILFALYFVGKYCAIAFEDVKFAALAIQPVFVVIIGAIAYEDGQLKRSGYRPDMEL